MLMLCIIPPMDMVMGTDHTLLAMLIILDTPIMDTPIPLTPMVNDLLIPKPLLKQL